MKKPYELKAESVELQRLIEAAASKCAFGCYYEGSHPACDSELCEALKPFDTPIKTGKSRPVKVARVRKSIADVNAEIFGEPKPISADDQKFLKEVSETYSDKNTVEFEMDLDFFEEE